MGLNKTKIEYLWKQNQKTGRLHRWQKAFKKNNEAATNAIVEQAHAAVQASNQETVAEPIAEHTTAAMAGSAKLSPPKKRRVYESGISENVAHGIQLLDILLTFGLSYNPSNLSLTPESLEALNVLGTEFLNNVRMLKQGNKEAIDNRKEVYRNLKKLATRILNELMASGAPEGAIKNAKHAVEKMRGHRIIKIKASETNEKHISACQTSFTQMVDHFSELILVVSNCVEYNPNVPELKVTTLEDKRDAMIASNKGASLSSAKWSTSLTERNEFFNALQTGYVDTYAAVKRAVKAIYGARSAQYKQISGFTFKYIYK